MAIRPYNVDNPYVNFFYAFDMSDELELRNRYFLYTPTNDLNDPGNGIYFATTRAGNVWPNTLNSPSYIMGKRLPFTKR